MDSNEIETLPSDTQAGENENTSTNEGKNALLYQVDDVPPWYLCILLGFQQYLTMFSSSISIPYLLAPELCLSDDNPARAHLISSLLFSSGIITILQTTFGIRLPIVQGGTFAFLIPIISTLNLPEFKCPERNATSGILSIEGNGQLSQMDSDEMWQERMRMVQGSIIVASLLEIGLGLTGCIGAILQFITPLTIVPTIALVGLSLFPVAVDTASGSWPISLGTIVLLFIFSQYMNAVNIPLPKYVRGKGFRPAWVPVFALLPVLLTIIIMWVICIILTSSNAIPLNSEARTDSKRRIMDDSPWVRVPYPGQWGPPTLSVAAVIGLFAGVIASIVESLGDYFACARLSGAPPLPRHAINRGIMIEGLGCVVAGLFGTGVGTTSYSENIGAIGITRVASRRVIQFAGGILIILGMFTKFGALFVSIPTPIVGGIFLVMFGMITAVGLSNLQFVDLNSPRNLVICGFSIFSGLAIPKWVSEHKDAIQTGNGLADGVFVVLLSTSMLVGGVIGCFLDNTIPGSKEERGLIQWNELSTSTKVATDSASSYDIPFITSFLRRKQIGRFIPVCPTFDEALCQKRCAFWSRSKEPALTTSYTAEQFDNGKDNKGFELSSV